MKAVKTSWAWLKIETQTGSGAHMKTGLTVLGRQSPGDLPCNVEYTCGVGRAMRTVNVQAELPEVGVQLVNLLVDKLIHVWSPDPPARALLPYGTIIGTPKVRL